ncbi:uncharacterized protein [Oscarella lobularis]|uniref:uncharacterized protein n=1 Tax=Oscarella lobularis TaxID=121494 RepID=UPI0033138959
MTRLFLFHSIAVAVIIISSFSHAGEPEKQTKFLYSSKVYWNAFHSHFRIQYKVLRKSAFLRISYAQQCVIGRTGGKWEYAKSSYVEMKLNLNPSQKTKTACSQIYGTDEKPKKNCERFRLKIKITYRNYQIEHVTRPDWWDTCDSSKKRYTANCDFKNKDSCGYRNDLCSLGSWKYGGKTANDHSTSKERRPLRDFDTPVSCGLLSELDLEVLQPSEFNEFFREKEQPPKFNESVETPETRIAKSAAHGYYLCVDGKKAGRRVAVTGIINSPILTKHARYNKALRFRYIFEHSGVHSLFVALICVSDNNRILRLKDKFTHFRLVNRKEQPKNLNAAACLDLHTFLGGCKRFQVQFVGGARGSRLIIDDVKYSSRCPSGKYDNR